jgi:hypothetical protein
MSTPGDPPPPPASATAAAQRGFKHWMIIGVGAAVLIFVFLLRR